ncbi:MAG: apolipoprotein N-acyltransferase [Bacteroidia bacterium]|nr:apolipoprotein N-acyltransferase [Bacteroidia bacterium]
MLGISFPPIPFAFLLLAAFVPIFYVADEVKEKQNPMRFWFGCTYLGFLVWNLVGCYWLMLTALSAPNFSEALLSFTAGLLANLANPVLMSIPTFIWQWLRIKNTKLSSPFWLIPFWLSFEYLHYQWDLTWSWLTIGHAFSTFPVYIQYIEFTGTLGISCFVLMSNATVYHLLKSPTTKKITAVLIFWLLPFTCYPILTSSSRFQETGKLRFRVIQPNIDPYQKFNVLSDTEQIRLLQQLIISKPLDSISVVVLPETALPGIHSREEIQNNPTLKPLVDLVKEKNLHLIAGLNEYKLFPPGKQPTASARPYGNAWIEIYNSMVIISPETVQTYQKGRLVPFVERAPFLEQLNFLKEINIDLGGGLGNCGLPDSIFTPFIQNHRIIPMICYESIFGDYVRQFVAKGGEIGVIITNDGWWKQTSGYLQHAQFSVLRAIESRKQIARSANTGRSLYVNHLGKIIQYTDWWKPSVIDQELELYNSQTFYIKYGNWLGKSSLMIIAILFLWFFSSNFPHKKFIIRG